MMLPPPLCTWVQTASVVPVNAQAKLATLSGVVCKLQAWLAGGEGETYPFELLDWYLTVDAPSVRVMLGDKAHAGDAVGHEIT